MTVFVDLQMVNIWTMLPASQTNSSLPSLLSKWATFGQCYQLRKHLYLVHPPLNTSTEAEQWKLATSESQDLPILSCYLDSIYLKLNYQILIHYLWVHFQPFFTKVEDLDFSLSTAIKGLSYF